MTPVLYSSDVAIGIGPGCIVKALAKLDGQMHKEGQVVRELLADWPHSDLSVCALFLRDNVRETIDVARTFGLRQMANKRVELTKQTKKRFINILLRVARAHEGISREEREFIRQFWEELQRL
ncbi:TerB family tellurite resistance protein [Spirosoma spitsbergense]|uniref:tellurite resistance TerB family protein n=1 Tax=Spirosoma spitsbergense TaxID=431554 RepID=UPI00039A1F8E|nr:TerB family tellurite resistance protein [Spirosoma spitsbergense]